jgi:hypothetical protein
LTKPFDGEFRLENVPPGVCLFEIFDSHGNSVHVETVLVETLDVHGLTIALDVPGQGDLAASLHGRREWTARAPFVNVTSSDGRVTRACSTSEEHLEFRDAGPGPYRVRVEDVAFRPTVFENLTPVEGRVSLENAVVGPCALKLDVRDASGAPILTSYRVTVCRVTVEESANRERDADESTAVDSTFLLDNLPAEPLSLEVDCGHMYEVKAVRIDSLTPGETSTLEVRMEPNRVRDSWGTLVGVVADPRNAGSNKRIDIDIAYVPEKGEREAYEKPRCRHFRLERFPDAGKVTLRWLDPNECALVVGCGDSRKATSRVLTVGNGEEVNFGTLTLPEGPRVRGRVILPEGARRWTAALVCDARLDCPLVKGCDRHGMASIANLGPDGAFAFKDLGPGVYKAYYQPSRNRTLARSPGVMGPSIFVGSFEVKGSDLENVVLDAREGWMGQLDLQLRADGRPLTAALVRIHRSGDDRYEEYAGSDVDGRMLLDPMPLGDFELDIQDRANGWVYRVPGRWAVSTEARTHVLDIPAVECRITALTAVGAPLRNTRLWLFGGFGRDAMTNITERTTDSEGILTIRLPKAPGTLSLSTSEDMFDATFESAPPATLTAKFGYQAK